MEKNLIYNKNDKRGFICWGFILDCVNDYDILYISVIYIKAISKCKFYVCWIWKMILTMTCQDIPELDGLD